MAATSVRGRLAGLPLRNRLVAILVALALVALAVTGAVAVALLRGQLVEKVDSQLTTVAESTMRYGRLPPGAGSASTDRRGQLASTTYGAVVLDTGEALLFDQQGGNQDAVPRLTSVTPEVVAAQRGKAFTVPTADGTGRCRVVALRTSVQGQAGTLVVGQSLGDVDDTVAQMTTVLLLVGLGVLVAVAVTGGFVVRGALRPLTEVEATAAAIAGGDLSRRVPHHPASTEVGRLSAALNAMLTQIEQSFAVRQASEERMRRFVSDASHELRTPLAAVRGYAELYRQGAVREPEQVTGAMRRIEDEATRMGGLVEDLLTLARLDEQRQDRRRPVDLTVLAADAVQDARALDADRRVTLTGRGAPLGPVVVDGDEPRLRQVLTNLVANALRHTPAATPVELAVGAQDGYGYVEVRDHGPGIAPEHARQVFERFFRADASRQRALGGGSGLGLAIVAAIVSAHHGQVGVSQTVGGGATFVVRLPFRATDEHGPDGPTDGVGPDDGGHDDEGPDDGGHDDADPAADDAADGNRSERPHPTTGQDSQQAPSRSADGDQPDGVEWSQQPTRTR